MSFEVKCSKCGHKGKIKSNSMIYRCSNCGQLQGEEEQVKIEPRPLIATKIVSFKVMNNEQVEELNKNIAWIVIDEEVGHVSIIWMKKEYSTPDSTYRKEIVARAKDMLKKLEGYDFYPDLLISGLNPQVLHNFLQNET